MNNSDFINVNLGVLEFSSIALLSIALLSIAFVYSAYMIFTQVKRRHSSVKYLLVILHLIAFLSILGLILQPNFKSMQTENIKLVTNSNFLELEDNQSKSYLLLGTSTQTVENTKRFQKFSHKILYTPEQLLLKHPTLAKLEIIGDGLTKNQWQKFPDLEIVHQVPKLNNGIVQPSWKNSINLGESLEFTGRFQSDSQEIYSVHLINPAGDIIDSQNVTANDLFSLSDQPKLSGFHKYQVVIHKNGIAINIQEEIMLHVTEISRAKILVLQSAPSFETKQLQNWAGEKGVQVLVRSKVSREKYITRSTNLSESSLKIRKDKKLDEDLLNQFDIVIIDGRELMSLSDNESFSLKTSIENGLGLVVLIDQQILDSIGGDSPKLLNGFSFTPLKKDTEIIPHISNINRFSTPLSDISLPISAQTINYVDDIHHSSNIITTTSGNNIVATRAMKLGQLAVSLLKETSRLVTSGEANSYAKLWQSIIKQVSRKKQIARIQLAPNQSVFTKDRLTTVCYIRHPSDTTSLTRLNVTLQADRKVPQQILLQPNWLNKNKSCGYFWPKSSGWHKISSTDESLTENIFIFDENSWLAHKQLETIEATQTKKARYKVTDFKHFHLKKIDEWVFWWLFLVSASLIWIEKKIR